MKCNNCGGNLKAVEGFYICDNCGAKQSIASFFDNTEVYISYIESDMQGRRSRDSIIAQDLYNKLQGSKINTFYKRISAEDLTAENEEAVCTDVINKAKIIIMVGTSRDVFDELISKSGQFFNTKKIIPVYSAMSPADLPEQLAILQAMNYDTIGSLKDLQNNVLSSLGRKSEIDVLEIAEERTKRKKKITIAAIGTVFLLIATLASYYVFGTPYVLKSKKYAYAEALIAQKNYIEAIDILTNLGDYKNSQNELKQVYSNYIGYFINEDSTLNLFLYIKDNSNADIELRRIVNDSMVKTNVSAVIEKDIINFDFKDSWGNIGTGVLKLQNDGINLSTQMNNPSDVSLGGIEYLFSLDNRTEAPIDAPIAKEILMQLLENPTTVEDLEKKGYELDTLDYGLLKIKNTDVIIHTYPADDSQNDSPRIIFRISAPAKILLPDKVGAKFVACEENNFFYHAGYHLGEINGMNGVEDRPDETYSGTLKDTTEVILLYKNSPIFDNSWFDYFWVMHFLDDAMDKRFIGEDNMAYYLTKANLDSPSDLPLAEVINREGTITLYKMPKSNFVMSEIYKEHINDIMDNNDVNMHVQKFSQERNFTLIER